MQVRQFLCNLVNMIVVTANQKGGVGKSTIAVHLLCWLRDSGVDAVLVDSDAQSSSSIWAKEIDANLPIHRLQTAEEILEEVPKLAEQYPVVVMDGPAGLGEVTRATLLVSDLALIPCGPSVLDLRAASDAVRALNQVQNIRQGKPRGIFIPNKLQRNYRLSKELLETAAELGLEVAPGLGLRQAFADAAGQQTVVWKMDARAADAANEILTLFTKVFSLTKETADPSADTNEPSETAA